jgi:hypothetical protein
MLANDMKKGTVVYLKGTGWRATIMDNKKGAIRMADVEGIYREIGSIYAHDIAYIVTADGPVTVEFTKSQEKQIANIKAAGF